MTISEETLESAVNDLVDKLEDDKETGNLKLMNDSLFVTDLEMDLENENAFDIGEPKKKKEESITYI